MGYAIRIKPGSSVDLDKMDPNERGGLSKDEGLARIEKLGKRIEELQELLFASHQNALLIVLQGRDTAGKDGSIQRLLSYVNVQSTKVAPFKVPTEDELAHDFLWRVHRETPGKGQIHIFNRSHYEDVLAVRVHQLVPEDEWKARYAQINDFERLLCDSATIVLKFYLHIDQAEQEERLLAREKDSTKSWKLSVSDWKERALWDDYTEAYKAVLEKCSTDDAPWYVIPANHKWFRDLAIAETVVKALEKYESGWRKSLEALGKTRLAELEAYRKSLTPPA